MDYSAFDDKINIMFSVGKEKEVIEICDEYINNNQFIAEAYFNRGLANSRLNNLKQAIYDFDQSIKINPNNYLVYNNRANVKMLLKYNVQAIYDYDKAIELSPSISDLYFNRANAKCNLKNFNSAIVDYNVAIELSPADSGYYLNRATAYIEIRELDKALDDANTAVRLDSHNGIYIQAKYHIEQLLRDNQRNKENQDLLDKLESKYKKELELTQNKYATQISLLQEENKSLKVQKQLNQAIDITHEFDKRFYTHKLISIGALIFLICWTISILFLVTISLIDWSDSILGVTNMKNDGLDKIGYWSIYPYSQTFLLYVHKLTMWQHYLMLVPLVFIEYLLYTIYLRNMKLANFYHHKSTVGKSLEKLKQHYFDVKNSEEKKEFRMFALEQFKILYEPPSFIDKKSLFVRHGNSEIKIDADGSISKKDKK